MREALELSLNAATARLAHEVGLLPILETARRMGITSPLPPYPSVVLGAAEVTPFEVAQAYSVLANGGLRAAPLSIKKVARPRRPADRAQPGAARAGHPRRHRVPGHAPDGRRDRRRHRRRRAQARLQAARRRQDRHDQRLPRRLVRRLHARSADGRLGRLRPQARAQPHRRRGRAADLDGVHEARHRRAAAQSVRSTTGVTLVRIDPASGELATPQCPQTIEEAFYDGTEPTTPCPLHSSPAEEPAEAEDISRTEEPLGQHG